MSHRYSTAFSHICVAGCSIFFLYRGASADLWTATSYGIMTVNSLIGIWRYGNPNHGQSVDRVYRFTSFLQSLLALPCIGTRLWISHGHMPEIGYAHTGISILPLFTYLSSHSKDKEIVDIIIMLNVISASVVSFMAENYWGIATAVSYAISHFVITTSGDFFEVPALDLYNYSLCAYCFFVAKALLGGI